MYRPLFCILGILHGVDARKRDSKKPLSASYTVKSNLFEKNDFDGYFALIDQLDQFKVEQQKLLEFSGGAAIHWAALHGNCQAIKKLVQRGTSVEVRNSEGCTALHIAAHAKRFNAMKTLRELGADAYASNNNGDTPLDIDDTDTVDNRPPFLQPFAPGRSKAS